VTPPALRLRVLKAGLAYYALVFGAGFLLGPIRLFLLVPRVGVRTAELLELPVMLVICWLAARWVTARCQLPETIAPRLGMGLTALALLLLSEFSLVLWLRGLTFEQYLATRDPVSGNAYYLALGVMALLPLMVNRR
jgi:hypothetical protein